MALERVPLDLPPAFDGRDPAHVRALETMVKERLGEGWVVRVANAEESSVYAERELAVHEVAERTSTSMRVNLRTGTKPADGPQVDARLRKMHPGFVLTDFRPWQGEATLTKLNEETLHARDAIATAIGIPKEPWRVAIRPAGGGFDIRLPADRYVPGAHDKKIDEATITVIGRPGWYVRYNHNKMIAKIRPGELPTFPNLIPYPKNRPLSAKDTWNLPVGMVLPEAGRSEGEELVLDMADKPGALVVGTAGGGKSVAVNGLIYGALTRGWQVALCTSDTKKADFEPWIDYVMDYGFGCDSTEQTLAVISRIYELGKKRGELLSEHGVKKIQELPARVRPAPVLLVMDEVTNLFFMRPKLQGLPRDHPMVQEVTDHNAVAAMIRSTTEKIPAELRAAGVRIVVATQQAQGNTGFSVPFKTNLANRMLLGTDADRKARGHALLIPERVPQIPAHLADDSQAGRGVGVAELDGRAPCVFKGYFASEAELLGLLAAQGVPTTSTPKPTRAMIDKYSPVEHDAFAYDEPRTASALDHGFGQRDGRDIAEGDRLRGAAAAAHQLRVEADMAGRQA